MKRLVRYTGTRQPWEHKPMPIAMRELIFAHLMLAIDRKDIAETEALYRAGERWEPGCFIPF